MSVLMPSYPANAAAAKLTPAQRKHLEEQEGKHYHLSVIVDAVGNNKLVCKVIDRRVGLDKSCPSKVFDRLLDEQYNRLFKHGKGRKFDKEGNLKQWWTPSTVKEYVNRTSCFVQHYGSYYITEADDYIDGLQTLGENIADNGGVREAFQAYTMYVKNNKREPLLPGFENFTHEQLFFISFGNLWCESHTALAAKAALDDSHCPGWIRLKGVLTNSPEFSQTFGCRKGSGMNPVAEKCRIW
ncbi:neprilysin-1-like [Uranotaenia lowii]|uniref:neprilysin-1-like n=1 Tax=Uranotaenia lowii TaxID=190385 RepID=UPI00247A677E|nr:neprilysin-1-like [Uranotaenia lowii]